MEVEESGPPRDFEASFVSHVTLGTPPSVYRTRYHVDHARQRRPLCGEVVGEEWTPCCQEENTSAPQRALWAFCRSEALLFSLHMSTIVLGVIKEEVKNFKEDEIVELIHTVVETLVTAFLILIRTTTSWSLYYSYKKSTYLLFNPSDTSIVKGRSLKIWLWVYTFGAFFLGVVCLGGLIVCYYYLGLGWTVLTNQFCLIVILAMSDLFVARVTIATERYKEDYLKTVIHEGAWLIKESEAHQKKGVQEDTHRGRTEQFIASLSATPALILPDYIDIVDTPTSACGANRNAKIQTYI